MQRPLNLLSTPQENLLGESNNLLSRTLPPINHVIAGLLNSQQTLKSPVLFPSCLTTSPTLTSSTQDFLSQNQLLFHMRSLSLTPSLTAKKISPFVLTNNFPQLAPSQQSIQSTSLNSVKDSVNEKSNEICCSDKNFMDLAEIEQLKFEYQTTAKEIRQQCDAFCEMDDKLQIFVQTGKTFDLHSVKIKKHVPLTKKFSIFNYKNPKSKRFVRVLKCDHEDCGKNFRKWHNFFDHLRIHTNEKPYTCHYPGCGVSFTQRANLNKHLEVHGGNRRFNCQECGRKFFTNFNLKSHMRTHQKKEGTSPLAN